MSRRSLLIGNYICIKTVSRLLDSAELLLNSKNLDHVLGLYTLAIEEFGKAAIMKDCLIDDDSKVQKIPKNIFGKRKGGHNQKFKKALEILPDVCKIIPVGEKLTLPSGRKIKHQLGIQNKSISIPPNVTGTFLTDVLSKFDVRKRCFYVDWDENSNYWHKWRANLQTDKNSLKNAIQKFRKILPKYNIVELKTKSK